MQSVRIKAVMKSFREQLEETKVSLGYCKSDESARKGDKCHVQVEDVRVKGKEYKICPECGCKLRPSRFHKHISKQHGILTKEHNDEIFQSKTLDDKNKYTRCKICSASVKTRNIDKHTRRIHNKKNCKGLKNIKGGKKKQIKKQDSITSTPKPEVPLEDRKDSLAYVNTPQIGLGLESKQEIPRVKSDEVVIDRNTKRENQYDNHIIYVAGFSLKGGKKRK